ncbi:hypothetical protein EBU71_00345 [bacterium]|jgi:hypothetical protein|nr:hypothetical protein [Candidatus Elulimicrobium humile]
MLKFSDHKSFSQFIELKVQDKNNYEFYNHLDAVLEYAAENDIEVDSLKNLIQGSLKQKIEANAMDKNLLPRTAKLNI